jgi:Uma2 family endonuclease
MATVTETKPVAAEDRFLLTGIGWGFYRAFCDELEGRRIRLSYDRGNLEIMMTKAPHEFYKKLLARFIEAVALEWEIPIRSGGSMTIQRKDLERGFEPDECWWIANEHIVRGRREFNFRRDPPPDLAIEVEITSSLVDRIGIYAAMKVPEIWRFDGQTLRFQILKSTGKYHTARHSLAYPILRPEHVARFLILDPTVDETTCVRQFLELVRTLR